MIRSNCVLTPYSCTHLDVSVDLGGIGSVVHVGVFVSAHVDTVLC